MHVVRGLQQSLLLLVLTAGAAAAGAGLWWLMRGDFVRPYGLACLLTGTLIALTGGTELSRQVTTDARALLGAGPDREAPGTGAHLGPVGVFLFVAVPLALLGALLLDAS